jgi:cytochrome oxidase assembly protein ShyY1
VQSDDGLVKSRRKQLLVLCNKHVSYSVQWILITFMVRAGRGNIIGTSFNGKCGNKLIILMYCLITSLDTVT